MFGNGNQMAHLVSKHQWDKINKKLPGANAQAKTDLASACGDSSDEEAPMVLVTLLRDSDEGVQLQAIKSVGKIGDDRAKTHLLWLSDHSAGDKKEIKDAISEALEKINKRQ